MMRIYRDERGSLFWYEEGTQPEGYVLAEQKAEPAPAKKAATARNKAAKAESK